jgi:DNA-directed RNA polymerase subunit RPC12/RpoP
MSEVRKENGDALEYVCPECGATFAEGVEECASCGLEFDWSEELEYLCPECGTMVDPDQARCPGCGAKFSMEANGDVLIEYEPEVEQPSVEELLEAAIDEVRVRPEGEPEPTGEQAPVDEVKAPVRAVEARAKSEVPAARPKPTVEVDVVPVEAPKLYPGGFTALGVVFITLAVLSLVFTVLMARYDTWIQGAAEESMGDNQRMGFLAGLIGFSVFMVVAVYDLLRSPGKKESPA